MANYTKNKIKPRNPVAKAMLEQRQRPKTIPPKKGSKAKYNRKKINQDIILIYALLHSILPTTSFLLSKPKFFLFL